MLLLTTLAKAWAAGLDLKGLAVKGDPAVRSRLDAVARLEEEVLRHLPVSMRRPADLVEAALARIHFAPVVFGPISVEARTEMSPVWRRLLAELARVTEVRWMPGPRHVPTWVQDLGIPILKTTGRTPELRCESCASLRHEALEAMRWARALIASGDVRPEEIAISAASPDELDDHFLALSE